MLIRNIKSILRRPMILKLLYLLYMPNDQKTHYLIMNRLSRFEANNLKLLKLSRF
jgi:hypothetical protein